MKWIDKIIWWITSRPQMFKQAWHDYKIYAKCTYKRNKEIMDKLMGVKKE